MGYSLWGRTESDTTEQLSMHACTSVSLLFNMLSSFVIAFLPRSKSLLISWIQSLSMVIFEIGRAHV